MKKLTQKKINIINLLIALVALVLSFPTAINQIQQFRDQSEIKKTQILYYSPPKVSVKNAIKGFCGESILSTRIDAAGCIIENSIYDPCFWISEESDDISEYYFCPSRETRNNEGILIAVAKELMIDYRRSKNSSSSGILQTYLPWSIVLPDNTTCNILRGTSILSYDNNRVDYACTNNVQVSIGKILDDKYFFKCKYNGKTYFEECLAKIVVF